MSSPMELFQKTISPILDAITDRSLREKIESMATEEFSNVMIYTDRALNNFSRSHSLLAVYRVFDQNSLADTEVRSDFLRAVVVFIHASTEDQLRTIAGVLLPFSGSEALDQIPLSGSSQSGRAEKFFLGSLASYRGMTVDDLIHKSVQEQLSRLSFSNCGEIASLLRKIGIDPKSVEHHFPLMEQLIARRHQIVHQADLPLELGTESNLPRDITYAQVDEWHKMAQQFMLDLLTQFSSRTLIEHMEKGFAQENPPS